MFPPGRRSGTVALLLAFLLLACGGEDEPTEPEPDEPEPDPEVTTVEVTPSSARLTAIGDTAEFGAEARDQDGNPMSGVSFFWSVDPDSVAAVDGDGTVTAEAEGTATVEAEAEGVTGSADVTVTQEARSLEIAPDSTRLTAVGDTRDFDAEVTDANGNPVADAPTAWTVTDTGVATVDSSGRVVARDDGETLVVAESDGAADSAELVVDQEVASLSVDPDSARLTAVGDTRDFDAEATDANGNPVADASAAWSVGDTSVATVDSAGRAEARDDGSTLVVVASDGAADTADLVVDQQMAALSVTPDSGRLVEGNIIGFRAEAADANGHPMSEVPVRWRTADASVATVDSTGTAVGVGTGRTRVVAEHDTLTGSAPLRVVRRLLSVEGQVHMARGDVPPDLVAVLRHTDGHRDTARVESGGSFSVGTARSDLSEAHLAIDERRPGAREVHPFLLPAQVRDPGPHEVVLVPTEWTVRQGEFAGETAPVRLHQAIWQHACGDGAGGIWGGGYLDPQRDTLLLSPKVWKERYFPVGVGINHEDSNVPVTREDSVYIWDQLRDMERVFGRDLFEPVNWDPAWEFDEPGVIQLVVDTSVAAIARGGLGTGPEGEFMFTQRGLESYRRGADGFRGFRYQTGLGSQGNVTFGTVRGEQGWPVIHEFTHALGLDHTCSWTSTVFRSCSDDQLDPNARRLPSRADVVHLEVMEAVLREEHAHDTMLSLIPSLIGLRVLARGRDAPLSGPGATTASSSEVRCQSDL